MEIRLGPWYCDTCGEVIEEPVDGWVEWLSGPESQGSSRGIRIVHHTADRGDYMACKYDESAELSRDGSIVCGLPLGHMLGADGLVKLLGQLSSGCFADNSELFRMIQRLQVPGYEQAFRFVDEAVHDGYLDEPLVEGFLNSSQILAVKRWLAKGR